MVVRVNEWWKTREQMEMNKDGIKGKRPSVGIR